MKRLGFALTAVLMALFAAELLAMATGVSRSPAEDLYDDIHSHMYGLLPYAKIPMSLGGTDDSVNSLGFRGPEITAAKPPNTVRVFVVGDSTTFGHTLPNDQTYAALLGTLLAPDLAPRRLQVINAGIPGTTLPQHNFHIRNRILPLAPDILIVHTVADIAAPRLAALDKLRRRLREDLPEPAVHHILVRSHLYRALRRLIKGDVDPALRSNMERIVAMTDGEELPEAIFSAFRSDLADLARIARTNNVRLALLLPIVEPNARRIALAGCLQAGRLPNKHDYELFLATEETIAIPIEFGKREGIPVINPHEIFVPAVLEQELFFADGVHPNAAGHRLMADTIAASIRAQGWLAP
jgi:lysophospholipase L1-like esterase